MLFSLKRSLIPTALSVLGSPSVFGLTVILDFNDPNQSNTADIFGNGVSTFDVTGYGFAESQRGAVYNGILNKVLGHYRNIDLGAVDPSQTGRMLDIDFVIGDVGVAPSNGDTDFYTFQIGSALPGVGSLFGVAGLGVIRSPTGVANQFNIRRDDISGSVFTDAVNRLSGVGDQLTSGNEEATFNAISGTLSHEIGHALSLEHLNVFFSETPNGLPPLMAVTPLGLTNEQRLMPREFSISGINQEDGFRQQFHIQQLINAVGTRPIPEPSSALLLLISVATLSSVRRR